jgi:hypothetical protein
VPRRTRPSGLRFLATPDDLVKALSGYLFLDIPFEELRRLGWYDFLSFDHPETDDPVTMAGVALHYLFCGPEKSYDRLHGARRIVAFACARTARPMPGSEALRLLAEILEDGQPDLDAIQGWFSAQFR